MPPDLVENTRLLPLLEAPVRRARGADPGRAQRVPLHARSQHQQDRVHGVSIRYPRAVTAERMLGGSGQERLDPLPQPVGHPPAIVCAHKAHLSSSIAGQLLRHSRSEGGSLRTFRDRPLALKVSILRPIVERQQDAAIATNTSSFCVGELGDEIGAPERTLGTHYWNPPLLMPLVEVIPGPHTRSDLVQRVRGTLAGLGKRPIVVAKDVPGFVWNRLQIAVMREALWLVETGVVTSEQVDTVVREGLARRWRHVGPFEAAALGGADTGVGSERTCFRSFPTHTILPVWTAGSRSTRRCWQRRGAGGTNGLPQN